MHCRLTPPILRWLGPLRVWIVLGCLCSPSAQQSRAAEHRAGFDGPSPEWILLKTPGAPTLREQSTLGDELPRSGAGAEFLRMVAPHPAEAQIVYPLPPTLRLDETMLTLWVRYSRPNLALSVRLKFPNQIDPRTEKPLVAEISGENYDLTNSQWKQLSCSPNDRAFSQLMHRLRSQLGPQLKEADIDTRDVYLEAAILRARVDEGEVDLLIDELVLAPLVGLQTSSVVEEEVESSVAFSRILVGDNRITKDTRPFFPIIMPYHQEPIETFLKTGANVAWVERHDDAPLLRALAAQNLGVTATPPRIDRPIVRQQIDQASLSGDGEGRPASLPPFSKATAPIDFWMLDVNIPGTALESVLDWVDQIKDADYQHPRPILADVLGREREFHRQVSLLGSSKFILHTHTSPRELSDVLALKQRMGMPGKGMFTFIQLEPTISPVRSAGDGTSPLRIEPEQLFMLGNIALASGYKAVGYWNRNPIDEETSLALRLMNLHIRLLEPWLATGRVTGNAQVQFGPDRGAQAGKSKLPSVVSNRWDSAHRPVSDRVAQLEKQIRGTIIDSEFGMVVVINWLDDQAQFQPGPMIVDDLHLFVPRDVMKAYVVTATDCLPVTELKSVPGGTEISIRSLDQFAYILITHNQSVVDAVQQQIWQTREVAANCWVDLATAKVKRVRDVHRQIEFNAPSVLNAGAILSNADRALVEARRSLQHGYFKDAQDWSRMALSSTRTVQRRHWENAIARFSSPSASPYTVSFQSLPQHWAMMTELGANVPGAQTLLTTRQLLSHDQMQADGWVRQEMELPPSIRTAVEIRDGAETGRSCLRLAAGAGAELRRGMTGDSTLVRLESPSMQVEAGQLVHITGKIRLPQMLDPTGDGLHLYSTIDGAARCLRFRDPTPSGGWTTFELLSEARQAGEFRLVFELRGLGDVYLDDLRVVALQPSAAVP